VVYKVKSFSSYLTEQKKKGFFLQFVRTKGYDVLRVNRSGDLRWAEVRGKKGYEGHGYDPKDPLHKALDGLGKAVDLGALTAGDTVTINPKNPDAKKAFATAERIMKS
jgi:hypothetical protein